MDRALTRVCPRCKRLFSDEAKVCYEDGSALVAASAEDIATGRPVTPLPATTNAAPSTAPETIGQYRLLKLLGEGGMARIYLAEHQKLHRRCAIKRLHAGHLADKTTVARFLAEARAVGDIEHPNLVKVYDVIDDPDEICLVMEYLEGEDVAHVLRTEQRFAPERAVDIAAQVCDALAAVHERQIIHRDLKPENVFLTHDANGRELVKVLDFGVARLLGDRPDDLRTRSGITVGTPAYMSPEQATASPLDGRSDLYTVGVLLYEMVSGQPPFVGSGYGEVMLMHVNDEPTSLAERFPTTPPWLDAIVMRCLAKSPEHRYQSAGELAQALRNASPPAVMPVTRERTRVLPRKRWLAVATGALLGGLLVVGATAVSRRGQTPQRDVFSAPAPVLLPSAQAPLPPLAPVVANAPRRVRVISTPSGAAVSLEHAPQCRTPCDVTLPSERPRVALQVAAPGFLDEERVVDVAAPPSELHIALHRPAKRLFHLPQGPHRTGHSAPNRNSTIDPFH